MGVTGLWKLIEPCGKPVPVETLEGKVLAIDISIWLHQVVKGFQDNKGAALNNAHLLGLFHRLCKLMYYRVKPVFVFDGCVPQLKKDTIARRQQQRSKLNSEAERIQALLLQSLAKEKVVQQALGPNAELLLSPVKKLGGNKPARKEDTVDDMFKLPELPSGSGKNNPNQTDNEDTRESFSENSFHTDEYTTTSAEDSSYEESNHRLAYNTNIQALDVKSKEFLQLPADVRHEILVDIKETRKQSSWGRLHELPSKSDDFSNFQMKRLLKRRDVQVSLETAEQEMGGRTLTYAELNNIFSEEGILETNIVQKGTKQITSDEHTRFLLVKDLKKKLAKSKEEIVKDEKEETGKDDTKSSKQTEYDDDDGGDKKKGEKKLDNEYETDLKLAIALSLEDDANRVYDEKDYDYDSDESLKLSKDQRQQLQNAAKGPAVSYMIEYAGMNKEEVAGILEKTQNVDDTLDIEELIGDADEKAVDSTKPDEQKTNESHEIRLCVIDDSDATDSDLEEVPDNDIQPLQEHNKVTESNFKKFKNTNKIVTNKNCESDETDTDLEEVEDVNTKNELNESEEECIIEETPPCLPDEMASKPNVSKFLNIQIDLRKSLESEDDLFADVFQEIEAKEKINESERTTENKEVESSSDSKELQTALEENMEKVQLKQPPKTENILSILDELKQQARDIKNIKLENIKLSDSVIEISDDETALKGAEVKPEIIEVCDSDDNGKRCVTPSRSDMQSPKLQSKSPNLRTPSKNHAITEFFNVDYVVKRTPDKPLEEENGVIAKVKSPFFVRKTPKSERKSGSSNSSPSSNKKPSKVNKTLFEGEQHEIMISRKSDENLDNDFIPINEPKPSVSEQDVLNEAANILKSQKTSEELNSLASQLAKERQDLENERNRQDRMGMSVTQRMTSDCQELLRLFGVPFIVAPMEAEAQCAFLDIVELTHGTITDDSDIWLFGGRTVYKNFFAQNKHVLEFRAEQIEKDFNCNRQKLIQLACLVGSDYTTGIHGIGAVTALEILASFTPKDQAHGSVEPVPIAIQNILNTLQRFRNWWQSFKTSTAPPGSSARLTLQKKLKNIELHEGFPSTAVVEAYLTPKVDDNRDAFSWGYPDVESLREFARKNFGWTASKTDDILMPVIKKLNEKRTQQSIRNYFNVKNSLSLRQLRVSKRVHKAIEKMSGNMDSDDAAVAEKPTKAKRTRKSNNVASKKSNKEAVGEIKQIDDLISSSEPATCSHQIMARGPLQKATKRVNIPETKQIIPQREKDLAQMEAKKKLAAQVLKQTAKGTKKKRKA